MAKYDVVFVGLTILDIAGRPVAAVPEGGGVAEIRLNPAGTASGALMNAAKLGLSCATAAGVGDDEKGGFILDFYRRLGFDCSMLQITDAALPSATILPIRPNGERPALHCRGASDHLFVDDADFDTVCDSRFLHHGGTGLAMDYDLEQACRLATAVSGLVATGLGSDAGVIDLERTLAFIESAETLS